MKHAKVVLDRDFVISKIDEKVFGSFVEMLGRCVYGGLYEPGHPTADEDGFRQDVMEKIRPLNLFGTLFFAFSVSFDSLSIGIGLKYLFDSILMPISCFTIVSFTFTLLGFKLGNVLNQKLGRYSFL